ncbi:unnamed protein product [Calypogeia fissa]
MEVIDCGILGVQRSLGEEPPTAVKETEIAEFEELRNAGQSLQQLDDDQWFYEFALKQSERYSTLHRWIQIQANLQWLSESPISTKRLNGDEGKVRRARKQMRDPEEEARSDDEPETQVNLVSPPSAELEGSQRSTKSSFRIIPLCDAVLCQLKHLKLAGHLGEFGALPPLELLWRIWRQLHERIYRCKTVKLHTDCHMVFNASSIMADLFFPRTSFRASV